MTSRVNRTQPQRLRPTARRAARALRDQGSPTREIARVILLNKPYGVLCQFTAEGAHPTLKSYVPHAGVYAAGRLDLDSEGLVVLTDDGALQHEITDPRHKLAKVYWAQVEGVPDAMACDRLARGVTMRDYTTRPAIVSVEPEPAWLWPRVPPIRERRYIPTTWLRLELREGRNRQVRHMTAAVGHPTLRLIRERVAHWTLDGLGPGEWRLAARNANIPRVNPGGSDAL